MNGGIGMLGWIIGMAVVVLLFICLIFMIRHFNDSPACNMAEDAKYRHAVCNSANRDFRASLEQLLEILDDIRKSTEQGLPQAGGDMDVTNAFYRSAKDIYNKCLQVEKTVREIWSNPKYTKDFYFFVGLHYVSRYMGNILNAEQRNLNHFLEACTAAEATARQTVDQLIAEQEGVEEFEQRRQLRNQIEEQRQAMRDLDNLKSRFGEILTIYTDRIGRQSMETTKRADFIATHFKKMGPDWRMTMNLHPRRQ